MTLLLQIILPLIFALYLFTLYRNTTIGKAAFLLAVIIGIFGLENIFQHANLTDHAIYPYWGSLKWDSNKTALWELNKRLLKQ